MNVCTTHIKHNYISLYWGKNFFLRLYSFQQNKKKTVRSSKSNIAVVGGKVNDRLNIILSFKYTFLWGSPTATLKYLYFDFCDL